MTTQTAEHPHRVGAEFRGKYLSLTTFKRDGTGVATPVWFVADGDHLLVNTDPHSFKAKRIARNPRVTVALCSASGRLRGEPVPGHAEFLPPSELPRVERLMARKYSFDRLVILPIYWLIQRLRGRRGASESVALAITLT
jgi:PPOX class probable F420-dependent enzyme